VSWQQGRAAHRLRLFLRASPCRRGISHPGWDLIPKGEAQAPIPTCRAGSRSWSTRLSSMRLAPLPAGVIEAEQAAVGNTTSPRGRRKTAMGRGMAALDLRQPA